MNAFPFDERVVDYMRFQLGGGKGCVTLMFGSKPDTASFEFLYQMMKFMRDEYHADDLRKGKVEPCRYDR